MRAPRFRFFVIINNYSFVITNKKFDLTKTEILLQASNIREEERGENFIASSGTCVRRNKPKTAFRLKRGLRDPAYLHFREQK